jgi:hypothetical protein
MPGVMVTKTCLGHHEEQGLIKWWLKAPEWANG